jgi:hypothetical protein
MFQDNVRSMASGTKHYGKNQEAEFLQSVSCRVKFNQVCSVTGAVIVRALRNDQPFRLNAFRTSSKGRS